MMGAHTNCPFCQCSPVHNMETVRKRQQATELTATRRRSDWTEPDYEILARTDLSMREKAKLAGRTFYAMKSMQSKLVQGAKRAEQGKN